MRLWPTSEVPSKLLRKTAEKLGLTLKEASNHTDVLQINTGLKTQIPRHPRVKRELAREIIRYIILKKALGTDLPIVPESKKQ